MYIKSTRILFSEKKISEVFLYFLSLLDLTKYLENYASIGKKYVLILEDIIKNNSLTDFDKADLLPTRLRTGIAL